MSLALIRQNLSYVQGFLNLIVNFVRRVNKDELMKAIL